MKCLIVMDAPDEAQQCVEALRAGGYTCEPEIAPSWHEYTASVSARDYDVILLALQLPGWQPQAALELLEQLGKDTPVIALAGPDEESAALELVRQGATDYVYRDRLQRLPWAVRRAQGWRQAQEARRQAETRWREGEKRYHRLVEVSPDALFIIVDDQVAFANQAAARLVGAESPESLVQTAWLNLVHPDARSDLRRRMECFGAVQDPETFELRFVRPDGGTITARVTAAGISYHERAAVQFIARDVGDRRRVEETIQSLASFARLNPNPVFELAADGTLSYFNDAARELAESLGHKHPREILPEQTQAMVRLCISTGQKKLSLEQTVAGRTFAWSFFPVRSTPAVHAYVSEITDRLRLEAQLRQAQKLESVGRLAAGVAHDFNNILTVIKGHIGLLRSESQLSPATQESLQQVSQAIERASHLTNQLLAFTRRTALHRQKLDLNQVLANMSSLLKRTLGEDIQFHYEYAPDLPPVYADLSMIEQVVLALAVNARDAMPRGGQLALSTSVATIDDDYVARHHEARAGRFVCLSVADTGCGMDSVTLSRLFEPFFTTKEFGKGTGLGLATVYGIVKRHQGWIEVQSQLGQGSTFRIYLPPMDPSQERPTSAPAPARGGQETILVVEDEAPVLHVIRSALERYGYRVLEATNGVEALAVWHSHHNEIALLLTDMVMPVGLSGQELADKFCAQKPDLKVVYISGYSVEVAGRDWSVLEGVNFLQKPFDAETLAATVRRALDSPQATASAA